MKIGTKSILFGAHQFIIHPLFVAYAWWILYGFPKDYKLWIAFFVHDLGYWDKSNMDGEEGEKHPLFGANFMGNRYGKKWYEFCLFHSRFLAKKNNRNYSKLCPADKLSIAMEPWWLYLPRVILSGEIKEYMKIVETKHKYEPLTNKSKKAWFDSVQKYLYFWVSEYKDIKKDIHTKLKE